MDKDKHGWFQNLRLTHLVKTHRGATSSYLCSSEPMRTDRARSPVAAVTTGQQGWTVTSERPSPFGAGSMEAGRLRLAAAGRCLTRCEPGRPAIRLHHSGSSVSVHPWLNCCFEVHGQGQQKRRGFHHGWNIPKLVANLMSMPKERLHWTRRIESCRRSVKRWEIILTYSYYLMVALHCKFNQSQCL